MNVVQSETKSTLPAHFSLGQFSQSLLQAFPLHRILPWLEAPTEREPRVADRIAQQLTQLTGLRQFQLSLPRWLGDHDQLWALWKTGAPWLEDAEFGQAAQELLNEAGRLAAPLGGWHKLDASRKTEDALAIQTGLDFFQYLLPRILLAAAALRAHAGPETGGTEAKTTGKPMDVRGCLVGLREILQPDGHAHGRILRTLWAKYEMEVGDYLEPLQELPSFKRALSRLEEQVRLAAAQWAPQLEGAQLPVGTAALLRKLEAILPALLLNMCVLNFHFRPCGSTAHPLVVGAPAPRATVRPVPAKVRSRKPKAVPAPTAELAPA